MISPSKTIVTRIRYFLSHIRVASVLVLASLLGLGSYAINEINAHQTGISGQTEKTSSGPSAGCWCHCPNPSSATTVTLTTSGGSSPLTVGPNSTVHFTVTVANSNGTDNYGGVDIATYSGTGLLPSAGLLSLNTELTHDSPKAFSGGSASWDFAYSTGAVSGWDTIYATGNATNGNGNNGNGDCSDNWNNSQKFVIHIIGPAKRMALRGAVSLGSVRVGQRKADSLAIKSVGDQPITIASSAMKSGTQFSSYPSSTNRVLAVGTTEMDSVSFAPTGRGAFSDSVIYTTNSDSPLQQRFAVYVSGQGIQGIFNSGGVNSMPFGNVRVNIPTRSTLHYSNSGDDTLTLAAIPTVTGSCFTLAQQPHVLRLAPGQVDSVIVQFNPTSKIAYSGTLTFTASEGVTIPAISLSGTGIGPTFASASLLSVGAIRVGKTLQSSLQFRNAGTDTLHISGVTISQSGTKFTVVSFDPVLPPNSLGALHVSYTPNLEMNDTAQIHFATDDASNLSAVVTAVGYGTLPHIAMADKDTVDMGSIRVYDIQTRPFIILNNGSDVLHITSATAGPTPFSLAAGVDSVKAGGSDFVMVKFSPAAAGTFKGSLTINGDDPKIPSTTVYIKGTAISSALRVQPSTIDFGTIRVLSTLVDTVTVTNTSASPIKILHYDQSGFTSIFKIVDSSAHTVPANGSVKVLVSFTPPGQICYAGTITLSTDESGAASRTIGVTGCGDEGVLAMSPSALDFGVVDSGKSILQSAEFRNTGNLSLTIKSITFSGSSDFSYSGAQMPVTIKPGGSLPLDVIFSPTSIGEHTGVLVSTLDDETTIALQLSGYGASPLKAGVAGGTRTILSLMLAPNPAQDVVNLHFSLPLAPTLELHVFDRAGREVHTSNLGKLGSGEHSASLATQELPSGTYFVRVLGSNGEQVTSRLVIER